jgi:hypothetical protein
MLNTCPSTLMWRKSSFSESVNCVEVAINDRAVSIRDSKARNNEALSFSSSAWQEFTQAVRYSSQPTSTIPDYTGL